jgi:HNH endonuclease
MMADSRRKRSYKMRGICSCGNPCASINGRCLECFYKSGYNANKLEDALDRFIIADNGCWEWVGNINTQYGYGRFPFNGHNLQAHTAVWELLVGPFPPGLDPDHLCRNRKCVNPSHIEPVTRKVNVLRGMSPNAINSRKTHCPKGHPYSGDNLVINAQYHYNGKARVCKECHKLNQLAYTARKRQRVVAA